MGNKTKSAATDHDKALKVQDSNKTTSAIDKPNDEGRILKTFIHQVSGRAHMLKYDVTTICKSLSVRELNFYVGISPELRNFTARVKGVLFACLDENARIFKSSGVVVEVESRGSLQQQWSVPEQLCHDQTENPLHMSSGEGRNPKIDHGKVIFRGLERLELERDSHVFTRHRWTVDKDREARTEAVGQNPWSLRQHEREMRTMLEDEDARSVTVDLHRLVNVDLKSHVTEVARDQLIRSIEQQGSNRVRAYLMLEDVTAKYRLPAILDLKMGTQLERWDCSERKRHKHYNLVQRSSTGTLRLRIAGMQVYRVTSGEYLCRDKYYGRGLGASGFEECLRQFLHDGRRPLLHLIPAILTRIASLVSALTRMPSHRFYAASLLLAYEGDPCCRTPLTDDVTVRMIDFARSTRAGFMDDAPVYPGPDRDSIYALERLASLLRRIAADGKQIT